MPQSLASVLIHLIYSTKNRHPFLTPEVEPELHAYQAALFRELGCPALIINGMPDHVHALFHLSRAWPIFREVLFSAEEMRRAPLRPPTPRSPS